ncbi:RNA-binding cell elongation regulator Jag/EloR [Stomatobaculum longum]|jgi:SpoIIIJ-associated protein
MKTEVTVTGKTYDEALTKALLELGTTSERLEVSVLEQGSAGLLGFIGSKPWKLRAVLKTEPIRQESQTDEPASEEPVAEEAVKAEEVIPVAESGAEAPEEVREVEETVVTAEEETAVTVPEAPKENKKLGSETGITAALEAGKSSGTAFLRELFATLKLEAEIESDSRAAEKALFFRVRGENLGALIGKRGQTLDALQYLLGHVVNRQQDAFLRVKLDIGSYREKQENKLRGFARNAARRVKQSGKSLALDPMTPNERRIIHAALQRDRYVTTHSEGEGEKRHVVITLRKDADRQKKEESIK